jgi:hypothetical protein
MGLGLERPCGVFELCIAIAEKATFAFCKKFSTGTAFFQVLKICLYLF